MTTASGIPPTGPQPPAGPSVADDRVWHEYDATRAGIAAYDEHLFRIRSWNIAVNAVLLGGYFGINNDNPGFVSAGVGIFTICCVGTNFWLLDGLNKSLQSVHIFNARYLENCIRGEDIHFGIAISLRFEKKQKRHRRPAIKNLLDESVWPFYIFPIIFSSIIISLQSVVKSQCLPWQPMTDCEFAPDLFLIPMGLSVPFLLSFLSWSWRRENPAFRFLGSLRKNNKHKLKMSVRRKIVAELPGTVLDCEKSFSLFKSAFSTKDFAVFVDGPRRSLDPDYQRARINCLHRYGLSVIVWTLKSKWSEHPVHDKGSLTCAPAHCARPHDLTQLEAAGVVAVRP